MVSNEYLGGDSSEYANVNPKDTVPISTPKYLERSPYANGLPYLTNQSTFQSSVNNSSSNNATWSQSLNESKVVGTES